VLVTKAGEALAHTVLAEHPQARWHARSGKLVLRRADPRPGEVVVLCAWTGDLPVAEEAPARSMRSAATPTWWSTLGSAVSIGPSTRPSGCRRPPC
jgi:hypothetical protein